MGQPKRKEREKAAPADATAPTPSSATPFVPWKKPAGLSPKGWAILGGFILLMQVPLLHRALRPVAAKTVVLPFEDRFEDTDLQRRYWTSGGFWRVVGGELLAPGVKNNPLWLQASLPRDVEIEFDARSETVDGDVKVELFGDGYDHATGYILIHGGWNNTLTAIARLEEHGQAADGTKRLRTPEVLRAAQARGDPDKGTGLLKPDQPMRVEIRTFPVQIGKTYHWRIERKGSHLRWFIDGQPVLDLDDPFPLEGRGHDRFGFSNWESQAFFDNLKIRPL